MTFEDLNPFNGGQCYLTPNEQFMYWRELLKRIPIYKAAAICSGGEVGFFSILPLVRDELVLVDHSYYSLAVAMAKYALLREYGWRKAQKLLSEGGTPAKDALDRVKGELPERILKAYNKAGYEDDRPYYGYFDNDYGHSIANANDVKSEWSKPSAKLMRKAYSKLDRVSFIHGDLTDLIDRGPFNLLYISNAIEHTDRTGVNPLIERIEQLVKPGGYVIAATSRHGSNQFSSWKVVKTLNGNPSQGSRYYIDWNHTLYRLGKESK